MVFVLAVAFAAVAYISYDMGNRATASETLKTNGTAVGNALVIYDPSITDNTKNVASIIARDLQSEGYNVDLASIKSTAAENISGYKVIVIGGPIYGGNSSAAVKSYLEKLKPADGTKIGVFATGDPHTTDVVLIKKQIVPFPENSTLQINAVMNVAMKDEKTKKCAEFVDKLLQ
nr:flavodoxin domain-containing protein [uncultured Methanobacterium sp.]